MNEFEWNLYLVVLSCSLVSMLGSGFICWMFLKYKQLQSFPYVLVFFLAAADFLNALALALPTQPTSNPALCQIQATLHGFSSLYSVLWTGTIPYALWMIVAKEEANYTRFVKRAAVLFTVLALVAAIVPLVLQLYAPTVPWCWIQDKDPTGVLMVFLTYYIFVTIVLLESIAFSLLTVSVLKKNPYASSSRKYLFKKVVLFPMVTAVAVLPLFILRLWYMITGEPSSSMFYVAAALYSLWGALNAIVYGITRRVREVLRGTADQDQSTPLDQSEATQLD